MSYILENKEAVENTALTFKNKDSEDLRLKLTEALNSSSFKIKFGKQAKLRAETEYNWKNIVDSIVKTYNDVLEEKGLNRKKQLKLKFVK